MMDPAPGSGPQIACLANEGVMQPCGYTSHSSSRRVRCLSAARPMTPAARASQRRSELSRGEGRGGSELGMERRVSRP